MIMRQAYFSIDEYGLLVHNMNNVAGGVAGEADR